METQSIRGKNLLKEQGVFGGTDKERKEDLQLDIDHPTAKVIGATEEVMVLSFIGRIESS